MTESHDPRRRKSTRRRKKSARKAPQQQADIAWLLVPGTIVLAGLLLLGGILFIAGQDGDDVAENDVAGSETGPVPLDSIDEPANADAKPAPQPLSAEQVAAAEKALPGRYLLVLTANWVTPEQPGGGPETVSKETRVSHFPVFEVQVDGEQWTTKFLDEVWSGTVHELQDWKLVVSQEQLPPEFSDLPHFEDQDLQLTISTERLKTYGTAPGWRVNVSGFSKYVPMETEIYPFVNGEAKFLKPPPGSKVVERSTVINGQVVSSHAEVRIPGTPGFKSIGAYLQPLRESTAPAELAEGETRRVTGIKELGVSLTVSPNGRVLATDLSGRSRLIEVDEDVPITMITLPGMTDFPGFVEFMTDDRVVVAAGRSDTLTLKVIDLSAPDQTVRELPVSVPLAGNSDSQPFFQKFQLSDDGQRALAVYYQTTSMAVVIDLASGESLIRKPLVSPLAFLTGDGRRVMCASAENTLTAFDVETGAENGTLQLDSRRRIQAVSSDGNLIAESERLGRLRLVDFRAQQPKVWLIPIVDGPRPDLEVVQSAFTSTGNRVVSLHRDRSIRLWDTSSGRQLNAVHFDSSELRNSSRWDGIDFIPVNRSWFLKRKALQRSRTPLPAASIRPVGDAGVICSLPDGTVSFWDFERVEPTSAPSLTATLLAGGPSDLPAGVSLKSRHEKTRPNPVPGVYKRSAGYGRLEAGTVLDTTADGTMRVVVQPDDPPYAVVDEQGQTLSRFQAPDEFIVNEVKAAAVNPAGESFAFSDGSNVWLHNSLTGKPSRTYSGGGVTCFGLGFSPDGRYLFCLGNSDLYIFDARTLKGVYRVFGVEAVIAFGASKPGQFVALKENAEGFQAMEIRGKVVAPLYDERVIPERKLVAVTHGANGTLVGVLDEIGSFVAYELFSGKHVLTFPEDSRLRIDSEGKRYFAIHKAGISIFDASTRRLIRQVPPPDDSRRVHPTDIYLISPDEKQIARVYMGNVYQKLQIRTDLFSTDSGEPTGSLTIDLPADARDECTCAAFADREGFLCLGTDDGSVLIVDVSSGNILARGQLPNRIVDMQFRGNDLYLLVEDGGESLYFRCDCSGVTAVEHM